MFINSTSSELMGRDGLPGIPFFCVFLLRLCREKHKEDLRVAWIMKSVQLSELSGRLLDQRDNKRFQEEMVSQGWGRAGYSKTLKSLDFGIGRGSKF